LNRLDNSFVTKGGKMGLKPFDRNEVIKLIEDEDIAELWKYNLQYSDLSGTDLRAANLSCVNLSGADLSGTDLSGTDLSGANLSGANLSGASLSCANLRNVSLCSADISSSVLYEANLNGANLSGANLCNASLDGADIGNANLNGANLCGAKIDFSCLPLWCGGLNIKIDVRIARQIAYHLCSMQCDDPEFITVRNAMLPFANKFHRVKECGRLEKGE